MSSRDDKWIRSLKDNPAGKVVPDGKGSRWEWQEPEDDGTSRLLRKLENDELAIERTDIVRRPRELPGRPEKAPRDAAPRPRSQRASRDPGGGFNPYDHAPGPRRRR